MKAKQTIVRDLSWLAFNERVLQEAKDPSNHLYDRLRFLGIFSNNMDEFFRVRVATLRKMVMLKKPARMHLETNPDKILQQIQHTVMAQQKQFDNAYADIIRGLADSGIFIKNEKQLTKTQRDFVTTYFDEKVRTQITPLMIETIPQFPILRDKSIYLACLLGNTGNSMLQRYSLIEIPRVLPRFIILPSEEGAKDIILLEDIIRVNLPHLFAPFGFNRFSGYIIKVTRDAELEIDNDINTNLIDELEKGLKNRKKGRATRFVFDRNIDEGLMDYLIRRLGMTKKDNLIPGGRIHNFKDFMSFPPAVFNDLAKQRAKPFVHPLLKQPVRIMEVMEKRDVLLHFPYHSFDSIIDLLREAAIDPMVQSIKITCYRLAKDSKVVNTLINAVRNGKQVTVMMELRARFDEEANLFWKGYLEEEGVKVLMGIPDMKVHAKLCIIKKREFNRIKQYGFISTGNFNENTSEIYGDHCLLTTNRNILADINRIFALLESPMPKIESLKAVKTLPVAPINMRRFFVNQINKEIRAARKKKDASMIIKLNSLVDNELIMKIYDAAKDGVDIKMIIRGICAAYTEYKSFKGNLEAISIIDQYLEHSRVFVFDNGKKPNVFISSGDWMVRNLDHRIEVACPIFDPEIQQELIDTLNIQLSENVKGRILDDDQSNDYVQRKEGEPEVRSQVAIYQYLVNKRYET